MIGRLEKKNGIWVYDVSSGEVSTRVSYNMDGFKKLRISVRLSLLEFFYVNGNFDQLFVNGFI